MTALASFLSTGLLVWLGLLAALIAMRMLNGRIAVTGFFVPRNGKPIAPERLIAMAVFPLILMKFVYDALNADIGSMAPPTLPDVSDDAIALLTGSNVLYLSGKIARPK